MNNGNTVTSTTIINPPKRPSFLNKRNTRTFTNIKQITSKGTFTNINFRPSSTFVPTPGYVFKRGNKGLGMYKNTVQGPTILNIRKPKKPSFLNKSFIATKTIVPMPGYVFKTGNKGLGMYANNKTTNVVGPVQGPVGPIEGPKAVETRNRNIEEQELLLRSYLNRKNVSNYINNSQKTNALNKVKRGMKIGDVKTYINGIISGKVSNAEQIERRKIKLEQNRVELEKVIGQLTNLTNTNKSEILGKFNSNSNLNSAKTLAMNKDKSIKKSKLENMKTNLATFLENKNVNNKRTYVNRLNAGESMSNLKAEIIAIVNKKESNRKNYDLKLKELSVLLNSSNNLNNSMKAKFLRNFEQTKNFNKVRKDVEDELKKNKN